MSAPHLADASLGLRHVNVRDMMLSASIGVYAKEHAQRQRVRINVDLAVQDDGASPMSRTPVGRDEIDRIVDYAVIADGVRALVAAGHVRLVETLAERLAEMCLQDPRVFAARIRVEKLDVFADAASVGVEVERRRR